jgi:hypothetical protein
MDLLYILYKVPPSNAACMPESIMDGPDQHDPMREGSGAHYFRQDKQDVQSGFGINVVAMVIRGRGNQVELAAL